MFHPSALRGLLGAPDGETTRHCAKFCCFKGGHSVKLWPWFTSCWKIFWIGKDSGGMFGLKLRFNDGGLSKMRLERSTQLQSLDISVPKNTSQVRGVPCWGAWSLRKVIFRLTKTNMAPPTWRLDNDTRRCACPQYLNDLIDSRLLHSPLQLNQ